MPVANVRRGGRPKIIVTPLASSINFRSWKLKLQRTVGPLLVYSCWAWPCPQSNASVLERLPSYVRRKDRCSEVLDPIQSSHVWLGCGQRSRVNNSNPSQATRVSLVGKSWQFPTEVCQNNLHIVDSSEVNAWTLQHTVDAGLVFF